MLFCDGELLPIGLSAQVLQDIRRATVFTHCLSPTASPLLVLRGHLGLLEQLLY